MPFATKAVSMARHLFAERAERAADAMMPDALVSRIDHALRAADGWRDPWHLDPAVVKAGFAATRWLYSTYFRVRWRGPRRLPEGRVMIVANHSGQIPFDALMLIHALVAELDAPRLGRAMVDRWVSTLPLVRDLFAAAGEREQCVVVFPEGTRGLGKPYSERYRLQRCGEGFARMASEMRTPIVPVAFVGAEGI